MGKSLCLAGVGLCALILAGACPAAANGGQIMEMADYRGERRQIELNLQCPVQDDGKQLKSTAVTMAYKDSGGKIIAAETVRLAGNPLVLQVPEKTVRLEWCQRSIADSKDKKFFLIKSPLVLISGKDRYDVEMVPVPPVHVTISLKGIGGRGKIDECYGYETHSEILGQRGRYYFKADANGDVSFWGCPGVDYYLELRLLFGRQGVCMWTQKYHAEANADNKFTWNAPQWKLMDIYCYESVNGVKVKCPEANIGITDVKSGQRVFVPLVDGHTLVNFQDKFDNLDNVKQLKFEVNTGNPYGCKVVNGREADISSSRHEIVYTGGKRRKDVLAMVTDSAGNPLPSTMTVIHPGQPVADLKGCDDLRVMHGMQDGEGQELVFFSPGYRAMRFRNINVNAASPTKIVVGKLEEGDTVTGTIANSGDFPDNLTEDSVDGIPPLLIALVYPQVLGLDPVQNTLQYDPTTGKFSVKCDLRLRPHLYCLHRHGDDVSVTIVPLTADSPAEPLVLTLRLQTAVSGALPKRLLALKDSGGRPYNNLMFVNSTGIPAGTVSAIPPDGKWKADLQPGEYRVVFGGGDEGILLPGKVVVGDKPQELTLPVSENLEQIKPAAIPELLMGFVPALDWSVIP